MPGHPIPLVFLENRRKGRFSAFLLYCTMLFPSNNAAKRCLGCLCEACSEAVAVLKLKRWRAPGGVWSGRCPRAAAPPFYCQAGCWGRPCVAGEALTDTKCRLCLLGDLFCPRGGLLIVSSKGGGPFGATLRSMVVLLPPFFGTRALVRCC